MNHSETVRNILRMLNKTSRKEGGIRVENVMAYLAEAQVHATLALVDAVDALADKVVQREQ